MAGLIPLMSVEPMRTLIIPDIHNHTDHADHWLATQRKSKMLDPRRG